MSEQAFLLSMLPSKYVYQNTKAMTTGASSLCIDPTTDGAQMNAEAFGHLIDYLHAGVISGSLPQEAVDAFRQCLGEALSTNTLQGWAFQKPHGYAGDFQMLDYIYQEHQNGSSGYNDWDAVFPAM